MPLFVNKLLKLAVSVYLLCLLMVVICSAGGMVRPMRLYNECSGRFIKLDMKGRVLADDDSSDKFQNLTIRSNDVLRVTNDVPWIKLNIFGEEAQRYICFNQRWKLVGSKKFRGPMCQFYEEMLETGYNRYRSVVDQNYYIGFNRKGRPLKGLAAKSAKRNKCLNFMKFNSYFDIAKHNDVVGRSSGGGRVNQSAINTDHLLRHKLQGKPMRATKSTTTTTTTRPSPPKHMFIPRLRHRGRG